MLTGACRLDRGVQGQEIGLARDVLHDADMLVDRVDRLNGADHRLARLAGRLRGAPRDRLGLPGILGALAQIGGHLLHRRRGLFGGGGLFRRARRQLLGRDGRLAGACGHLIGRRAHLGQDVPQAGARLFQPVEQRADLVAAPMANGLGDLAPAEPLGLRNGDGKPPVDEKAQPDGCAKAEENGSGDDRDENVAGGVIGVFRTLGLLGRGLLLQLRKRADAVQNDLHGGHRLAFDDPKRVRRSAQLACVGCRRLIARDGIAQRVHLIDRKAGVGAIGVDTGFRPCQRRIDGPVHLAVTGRVGDEKRAIDDAPGVQQIGADVGEPKALREGPIVKVHESIIGPAEAVDPNEANRRHGHQNNREAAREFLPDRKPHDLPLRT